MYVILNIDPSFHIKINCVEECYFTSDLGAYYVARLYAYERLAIIQNSV